MALVFLLILSLLLFYYFKKEPGIILAYLFFFHQISQVIFSGMGLDMFRFVFFLLIMLCYIAIYYEEEFKTSKLNFVLKNPLMYAIIIILLGMLWHYFIIGINNDLGLDLVQRYILQNLPLILFATFFLTNKKNFQGIGKGILIFGILFFLTLFLISGLHAIDLDDRLGIRDASNINPIMVSRIFGMVLITSVVYLYNKKYNTIYINILSVISLVISIYMMLFSASRGPIIATLIALLFYFILKSKNSLQTFKVIVILASIFLVGYIFLNVYDFIVINRLQGLLNYENMMRYQRLIAASQIYIDVIINGLGPGGFNELFGTGWVHNLILEMILEYGLFGVLASFLIITFGFYYSIKILKSNKFNFRSEIIIPIWVMFFFASLVSSHITGNREFWFTTGLIITMYYFLEKNGIAFIKTKIIENKLYVESKVVESK